MPTPKTETWSLTLTRTLRAPPERVFRAWTDPRALQAFHAPREGFTVPRVDVDLRVGGRFRIEMRDSDGQSHVAVGVYREIVPGARLVYTWTFERGPTACGGGPDMGDMGETLVTLDFCSKEGGTLLTLTHERFPDEDRKSRHNQGWTGILERLEAFVAKD